MSSLPNSLIPEVNPTTGELFLRLRHHKNIIITPHRVEDAPSMVPFFNDPRVYHWLLRPPFPYALSDAEEWLGIVIPQDKAYLEDIERAKGSKGFLRGSPFNILREVKEDGTDEFLGNITLKRCTFCEFLNTNTIDWENADKNEAINEGLEPGNPDIVWSVGYYLAPTHHGQGIMSDAVETLIYDWGIPRMNTRKYLVSAFTGNHGSVKVFQKNGFTLQRTIEEYGVIRGEMRGMHVLDWSVPEPEPVAAPTSVTIPEFNASTGEPFLRLRHHKNIIVTPHRFEDAPTMVKMFNDPRIYRWSLRSPFPYALSDAEAWLETCVPQDKALVEELRRAHGSEKFLTGSPFNVIREVKEDGSEEFIGNIKLRRCHCTELMNTDTVDFANAEKNKAANDALENGDPSIVWSFGYYLAPSHHGQGIMTDAVETLIQDWGLPRLNSRRFIVGAFTGNHGSVKTLQKNGFTLTRTIDEYGMAKGEMKGMHVLEWSADT